MLLVMLVVAACEHAKPTATRPVVVADAAPAVAKPKPPPPDAAPAKTATPTAWRGEPCAAAADCGWDDDCMPTRCGKPHTARAVCEESSPPPGACLCNEGQCSLKPDHPEVGRSATAGCTADADCAVDVGAAKCHFKGQTLIGPINEQGPVCACDKASGFCDFQWAGPVPCQTWKDCSWERKPRLRPVPSSSTPRPMDHPVKGCTDGEVDSVCTKQHVCRIVAFSC